jgi:hypothetical protein
MKSAFLLLVCVTGLAWAEDVGDNTDELVKVMGRRFSDVEEQLERSVRYSAKEVTGPDHKTRRAWFNGAGELLKVAEEQTGPQGRDLTEYFPHEFQTDRAMFMFTRQERALPDGGTQVDEERSYYGRGKLGNTSAIFLLRQMTKSGRFKPGETTDTVRIRNVPRRLYDKKSDAEAVEKLYKAADAMLNVPYEMAEELQKAGPPEHDPAAGIVGDLERYRLIAGTASPDGRYAIALSFSGKIQDWAEQWKSYAEGNDPETYFVESAIMGDGEDDVINVLVDLQTRRIMGQTGCFYMGTRGRYNHRACEVTWSPDSKTFLQLFDNKWNYENCHAGRIDAGGKLLGTINVGAAADDRASAYLKAHKSKEEEGETSIIVNALTNDGMMDLVVESYFRSGDRKGDYRFRIRERLRLRSAPKGLQLDTVEVRRFPTE